MTKKEATKYIRALRAVIKAPPQPCKMQISVEAHGWLWPGALKLEFDGFDRTLPAMPFEFYSCGDMTPEKHKALLDEDSALRRRSMNELFELNEAAKVRAWPKKRISEAIREAACR